MWIQIRQHLAENVWDSTVDLREANLNTDMAFALRSRTGGGALEWQKGVSGSSMDSQKAPYTRISWTEICVPKQV